MAEIEDGGPAFAHGNPEQGGDPGMSLRDWFASQMDRDEYGELAFNGLSQASKCLLAGPKPERPRDSASSEDRVAWQMADLEWELKVRAAVRYRYADAMLAARKP